MVPPPVDAPGVGLPLRPPVRPLKAALRLFGGPRRQGDLQGHFECRQALFPTRCAVLSINVDHARLAAG
eukprot:1621985-Pyramimonas_sp.AAC.1